MDTAKVKRPVPWGFLAATVWILLGAFVALFATAYRFTGLVCIGIGLIVVCYAVIRRLGIYHVNAAKILRLILSTLVLLGMLAAIATGILIGWAAEGHASINCRYIVVLGAGVDGTVPSLSLRERLDAAYDYLIAHPQTICVVSGGQGDGEDITEAECMYMDLIRRGIDPERIWQEDQATTTAENLRYSLALIEERTGKRPTQIGLVSSEYHLYRAGRMAADQGVSAVGIPAHTGLTILRWNYYLREIAAVWYYTILGG